MAARFSDVIVDCADPHRLAAFWCAVLGYVVVDETPDHVEIRPAQASPAELVEQFRSGPPVPTVGFARVPEGKVTKNRLHMEITPIDTDQTGEVARVLELGATRADIGTPTDATWVVLLDPEGNEFCVLRSLAPGEYTSQPSDQSSDAHVSPPQ